MAIWLILAAGAGWSFFGGDAPSPSRTELAALTAPSQGHATRKIQDVRVGDRVLGENPLPGDVEHFGAPEPDGWRRVKLVHIKPDGRRLDVEFLQPLDWFVASGARPGGTIDFHLPELGIHGTAKVVSIGP